MLATGKIVIERIDLKRTLLNLAFDGTAVATRKAEKERRDIRATESPLYLSAWN
jgi:hypothetical protein